MPLSEDEQRILNQIEQQFYESDPDFAHSVSQNSLYRHAFRNIKWSALLFVGGLAFLVATLQVHYALAFIGSSRDRMAQLYQRSRISSPQPGDGCS